MELQRHSVVHDDNEITRCLRAHSEKLPPSPMSPWGWEETIKSDQMNTAVSVRRGSTIPKFYCPLIFLQVCEDELARLEEEAGSEHIHLHITVTLNQCVISVDSCNCPSVYRHTQPCTDSTTEVKLHVLKPSPFSFKVPNYVTFLCTTSTESGLLTTHSLQCCRT